MDITFLNRCYWPDSEATGQLLTELCEDLAANGHQVTVVTGQPNVTAKSADEHYVSVGTQTRRGVRIVRCRHIHLFKGRYLSRLANLASFTIAAGRSLRRLPRPDLIVTETDPFFLPLLGARYSRKTGVPLVAYLQDIYPDVAVGIGKASEGFAVRSLRSRLKRAYELAQRVIVLSDGMANRLVSWGIEKNRLVVIPNWVDTERIKPVAPSMNHFREELLRKLGIASNGFIVMHSGNMGLTQPLDVLIRATQEPDFPSNAAVVLIGGGSREQKLRELAKELKTTRVLFLPYQPKDRLSETLSAADLHIVASDPRIDGCLAPSKLYGILAVGRPTLWLGKSNPLSADEESDAVILMDHELSAARVSQAIGAERLKSNSRNLTQAGNKDDDQRTDRIRALAVGSFDRRQAIRRLEQVFQESVSLDRA